MSWGLLRPLFGSKAMDPQSLYLAGLAPCAGRFFWQVAMKFKAITRVLENDV